jgi:hypothetical protein
MIPIWTGKTANSFALEGSTMPSLPSEHYHHHQMAQTMFYQAEWLPQIP